MAAPWRRAGLAAFGLALVAGCEEQAPRFDAPLASGVITLPMPDTQRFDGRLSASGLVAALRASGHADLEVSPLADDAGAFVVAMPRTGFEATVLGGGAVALDALLRDGHALVLGSGFTSVFNPVVPLGLLQLDGEVASEPARHGYTRVLGAQDGELAVIHVGTWHQGLFDSALQVGPGIVEAGRLDIRPTERQRPAYVRAFVATCREHYLAGIAQTPMHLYDLGQLLLAHFERTGRSCDEVANLSGDREALLAVAGADRRTIAYFGNPTLPKASIVAFRRRALT